MSTELIPFLVIAGIAAVIFAAAFRDRSRDRKRVHEKLRRSFGQVPDKEIPPERFEKIPYFFEKHRSDGQIDDITWNDLNMDDLYGRIDCTLSAAGEEYLYLLLRSPAHTEQQQAFREEQLRFFQDPANEEKRLQVQEILQQLGRTGKYSLFEYIDLLDRLGKRSNAYHYAAIAMPVFAFLIMFVNVQRGALLLAAAFVFNMITYFREKREIEPYIVSFRYLLRMIWAAEKLAGTDVPVLSEESGKLRQLASSLRHFRRGAFLLVLNSQSATSGNPADVILDYLRMFFHLDLLKFNSMLGDVRAHEAQIDELVMTAGKIDAMICTASFRESLPAYCEPALGENGAGGASGGTGEKPESAGDGPGSADRNWTFMAEGLFHPLLPEPVSNDFSADRRPVLITGANASGKSTFLKASALCAILAQTIRTAPADRYEGSYFRIFSSMALRDDIAGGESYFIVEIRSLKRILDAAEVPGPPILCCIDEVLRGTNTIERIAASEEILQAFADAGILCFAATHDIELTQLLSGSFRNMHFEGRIVEGDVSFDYLLKEGAASERNAIALLRAAGYDPGIADRAAERAHRFEETGSWI